MKEETELSAAAQLALCVSHARGWCMALLQMLKNRICGSEGQACLMELLPPRAPGSGGVLVETSVMTAERIIVNHLGASGSDLKIGREALPDMRGIVYDDGSRHARIIVRGRGGMRVVDARYTSVLRMMPFGLASISKIVDMKPSEVDRLLRDMGERRQ